MTPLRDAEHIMFARILAAQGRLDDALKFLERLSKEGEKGGSFPSQIETLLVQALVYQEQRNITQALLVLENALSLAEPVRNIYSKLYVHSRTEAIARAKELEIL